MNKRTLYLECNSGLSGDMFTAALLDLGADEAVLRKALASLPLDGFDIKISRVKKSGLDACDFDVALDAAHENHDHDMAYLYGDDHAHCHVHEHHHDHAHTHGDDGHDSVVRGGVPDAPHDGCHHHDDASHDHPHDHPHDHHHHHEHRGLAEILDILSRADLTPRARELAERIFTILGRAEAKAHGATLETVHFHEVGAVDSIVDITAAAVCLDNLGIEEVILPILYEGTGTIHCAHGVLPIPVPAVVNIAAAEHLNLHITTARGEYVTPTGAAIAAAIRTSETLPAAFTVEKIGLGAGKREQELPGFVRAMLIHPHSAADGDAQDTICKLETNIDDCTGEALGYVMERLMAAGARDVYYTPVYMKKNRPAYLLAVLCLPEDAAAMEQIIFAETTTIGIRRVKMERCVLKRRLRTVQTSLGSVQVKECEVPATGDAVHIRCYPEYESVRQLCREQGCNYQDACRTILKELDTKEMEN